MLFDLFACVDFGNNKVVCENPFKDLEPYKKMMFAEQEASFDDLYLLSLHKRHDDSFPVYQDKHYDIRIFGYCFARTDSKEFKDRSKLSANRIAKIYEENGSSFISKIKGSFSIFIFDKRKREMLIFSDPLNVRPLYYYQLDTKLVVSSSLSAVSRFIQDQKFVTSLNYSAIIEYYVFGYALNEDTHLKNVYKIPSGSILRYKSGGLKVEQYWNIFEVLKDFKIVFNDEQRAIDKLEQLLKKNLNLYLFDPDRTTIALTGGYNSRTNLALLGNKSKDFLFYSYGTENMYDLSIPQKIAKAINLRFKPIVFDETFNKSFHKNAELALGLGDGMADADQVSYLFAFKELGKSYDYILTGLFGAELINPPASPGDFINPDMRDLLEAPDKAEVIEKILNKAEEQGYIDKVVFQQHRKEIKERILSNPYIVNEYKLSERYFYFLMMIGIRKVYMKEIKVERPFVENLHPFLDIEFIELLLKTPFSWIHHWTGKGNLQNGINPDKLYVSLIDRNRPILNTILSTRGYTPKYLMKSYFSPFMKLEFMYYGSRMRTKKSFNTTNLIWEYFDQNNSLKFETDFLDNKRIEEKNDKNAVKLSALKHWLIKNSLVPKE